jgi:hypothetical protein
MRGLERGFWPVISTILGTCRFWLFLLGNKYRAARPPPFITRLLGLLLEASTTVAKVRIFGRQSPNVETWRGEKCEVPALRAKSVSRHGQRSENGVS